MDSIENPMMCIVTAYKRLHPDVRVVLRFTNPDDKDSGLIPGATVNVSAGPDVILMNLNSFEPYSALMAGVTMSFCRHRAGLIGGTIEDHMPSFIEAVIAAEKETQDEFMASFSPAPSEIH